MKSTRKLTTYVEFTAPETRPGCYVIESVHLALMVARLRLAKETGK